MATDAERCRGEDVIVVGGGNSAGQAAVHLASRARSVRVVVRGSALKSTMSAYLVDRIERSPHIEVLTETEVTAVHGSATVESVSLRNGDGSVRQEPTTAVFVMIGANPCTEAAQGMLAARPRRLPAVRHRRGGVRDPPRRGRWATASRTCWRPSAPACSPPATCAPAPRTAWRERSATARWSCASRTTCSTAPSGSTNVNGGWVGVGSEPPRRHECQLRVAYATVETDIRGLRGRSDPPLNAAVDF